MGVPTWKTSQAEFEENLQALARRRGIGEEPGGGGADSAQGAVEHIVESVRRRGDEAVLEFTERFDGCRLTPQQMRVSREETDAAVRSIPDDLMDALSAAAQRISRFQESILLRDPAPLDDGGRTLRLRYRPVESAGICVPGATASLASSVLMTCVPARVAGVQRIAMVTPPGPDGSVSADRLAAAHLAGVTEVYRVSGAQAVAALAFGTETIRAVDFIAGPGNIFVQLAKKLVFGQVGVDMLAGPSEVVMIADRTARADWIAADLISQAEHTQGSAILITDDEELASVAAEALDEQLTALPQADGVRDNLARFGAIIVARDLDECVRIADRLAPEHLAIMTTGPEQVCERIRNAGAVFVGRFTPVAVGDYIAGPSHCLPTQATARFSSGLTANTFLRSQSVIRYNAQALEADAGRVCSIAEVEKLEGHARSVRARLES
jgi:histidinol dehydrogenase